VPLAPIYTKFDLICQLHFEMQSKDVKECLTLE